ncbi:MAG TPA: isocitrate lyase [Anaerolineae bacterium]|nr:isocitrate lyase [Anaerolineae bacterium]
MYTPPEVDALEHAWKYDPRWKGVKRPYNAMEVIHLRGTLRIAHTLAERGAERLWKMLITEDYVPALGAVTGNQAVQMVEAGLRAIYVSGWQTAADNNTAYETYPDQSLYPVNSMPMLVRRINKALQRADQVAFIQGRHDIDWFVPLVADAESGFGGNLNTFELVKALIEAGAAGIHLEDQLSSAKKCGHMGGKVLVPTSEFIRKLVAARLAADVMGVPTILIARTDAFSAQLITSDVDPADAPFITDRRSPEGYYYIHGGLDYAIARGLAYAPYADLIWCETSYPDLKDAERFANAIHEKYPGKMLAYNCSPSFNWNRYMSEEEQRVFQKELGKMGYKFQFVTLAGFHAINASMFDLARQYREEGMAAYARYQAWEFEMEKKYGYRAVKHQAFVGAGYFDEVQLVITEGEAATTALIGSTEEEQFHE